LGLSPILALYTARGLYNAVCISKRKEQLSARDNWHDEEYRTWRERLKICGGLESVFCPLPIGVGETCYAYFYEVSPYAAVGSFMNLMEEDVPFFDTERGVPIARGWSVLDHCATTEYLGKAGMCVTDRHLYVKGISADLRIPLEDVRVVMAACSSILIGIQAFDRFLLIDAVNGQKIRDVLHVLMDALGILRDDHEDEEGSGSAKGSVRCCHDAGARP